MSSSPAMTKAVRHIAMLFGLMGLVIITQAQVVNIRLEVPAGVNFNSQVLDPMEGGTWENSKAKVWVGITTQENLCLLVDLEFPEREILPTPEAYFLNNGSDDFELARKLSIGTNELTMSSHPKLIRNMKPQTISLKAWLGVPILNGIIVKIEYP
jgi:hypothetical protein